MERAREVLKLEAEWTPDCQGKQDYDAELVTLSTRYWPRGGGFSVLNARTGDFATNEDQTICPSATATILLQKVELATASFEAETEEAVKAQVEAWAQEQFARIAQLLLEAVGLAQSKGDTTAG